MATAVIPMVVEAGFIAVLMGAGLIGLRAARKLR